MGFSYHLVYHKSRRVETSCSKEKCSHFTILESRLLSIFILYFCCPIVCKQCIYLSVKIQLKGLEMAQWLGALVALAENSGSVLSTHPHGGS